jgi:flagellin-like protein
LPGAKNEKGDGNRGHPKRRAFYGVITGLIIIAFVITASKITHAVIILAVLPMKIGTMI